jgi:putative flavoprotein involved in K+ transport
MQQEGTSYDVIIVGGGQAGLTAGYFLANQKVNFVILDENARTGDSWRKRWDSLRLFTPSQLNGLPGMPYPGPANYFPTKDELANYLEQYSKHFGLPVRHGAKAQRVSRQGDGYRADAGEMSLIARSIIVASGPYRLPRVPTFASLLNKDIGQLHSSAYCSPSQLTGQNVLIAGAGNSGAEIALELRAAGKEVWLAGRDVGVLPITRPAARAFGGRPFWWIARHVINVNTPIGRKARPQMIHHGHPLGRARREDLAKAGIKLAGRVTASEAGKPKLEDGQIMDVDTVIWATGYRPDFAWIDMPVFDEDGWPRHNQGIVADAPGLYFVGLPFQTAINSSLVGGVGADAQYIARQAIRRATAA